MLSQTTVINTLVALSTSLLVANALANGGDVYSNPTVGFSVTKPTTWKFVTAQQNSDNIARVQTDDKEMQALMLKHTTAPLVAFFKYEEPFGDVNPSFKVQFRPFGDMDPTKPSRVVDAVLPSLKRGFSDMIVEERSDERVVDGIKSSYLRMRYTLRTADGQNFLTTSELWVVPRGNFFFLLGAGTRTDERTGSRSEISSIVETIRIRQ